MVSPRNLLNRWIQLLDQHADFLTLTWVLNSKCRLSCCWSFPPTSIRTILWTKRFFAESRRRCWCRMSARKTSTEFLSVFVETEAVPCDPGCAAHLRYRCLTLGSKVLRACYSLDVFKLIKAISRHDRNPVRITCANIDRAADPYFALDPLINDDAPCANTAGGRDGETDSMYWVTSSRDVPMCCANNSCVKGIKYAPPTGKRPTLPLDPMQSP